MRAGAFGKGRSSSFKLNGILRSTMPYLLANLCHVTLVFIGAHFNLADAPSRFRPLPVAGPVPRWIAACRRERPRASTACGGPREEPPRALAEASG